jgi:hypothetical protein
MNNNEWQPIETAPTKAGTRVLLYFPAVHSCSMKEVMISQTMGQEEIIWKSDDGQCFKPTHWMPLPKPPAQ